MPLFDDIQREYLGPAKYSEPDFVYLNRSARPESERIRKILESWYDLFPDNGKDELKSRFISRDQNQHIGAFFELYCFALLHYQGYSIQLHIPTSSDVLTRPDFLVRREGEILFYFEATCAFDSNETIAARTRINDVIDYIDDTYSPNFFLGIQIINSTSQPPKISKLRSFLERKIQTISTESENLPSLLWDDNGWIIKFNLIAKSEKSSGKPGIRTIGTQVNEPSWMDSRKSLYRSLQSKSTKYGELDYPFVVAVNRVGEYVHDIDEIDIYEALWGREKIMINTLTGESSISRYRDGFWIGPNGPRNTRVSGALIVSQLRAWTINQYNPILYHNPWAKMELNHKLLSTTQKVPNHSTKGMQLIEGKTAADILKLL